MFLVFLPLAAMHWFDYVISAGFLRIPAQLGDVLILKHLMNLNIKCWAQAGAPEQEIHQSGRKLLEFCLKRTLLRIILSLRCHHNHVETVLFPFSPVYQVAWLYNMYSVQIFVSPMDFGLEKKEKCTSSLHFILLFYYFYF